MDGLRIRAWLLAGLLPTLPAIAAAGTVIETTGTNSRASVLYVDETNVRVESASSPNSATVFDRDAEELVFIDHSTRQYQRVGREYVRQIAQQIASARQEMKRRLDHMPEEHRDEMRAEIQEMMPGGERSAEVRIERGGTTTVAGLECREAVVHLEGEPTHAVCVASAENLGLSPSAFQTLDQMFAFFGEMTGGLSEGRGELGPRTTSVVMDALGGVPVRSEAVSDGASWSVSTVRTTHIAPEQFRVPAGYEEVDPMAQRED